MSGRKVPKERIFDNLDKVEVAGVSDIELNEYENIDDQIKSLLKLPPILNVFKSEKHRTVGELLDCYFMQYEMSRYSDNTAASFMIEIVLPFIAKRMKDFPAIPLKRSDVFEIMGTVTKLMLKNDSVYLNYIVQKGYNEESLPTVRDELINIILDTGIIISDKDEGLACTFINCLFMFINLLEPLKFSVSSDNKKYILAAFENAYFVLWDTDNEQIVWDNEFSEYVDEFEEFECAEFTDNNKFILISNSNGILKIETSSGKLCEQYSHEECYSKSYEEYCENNCEPQNVVDEELRCKILQKLPHFKNCIFTGVDFANEDYKRILSLMGAVVRKK